MDGVTLMGTSTVIGITAALSGVLGLLAWQERTAVDIDHVILGINDLERGVREFESRTGVTPKRGGEHPGRGTQNALVALGNGRYLEILAPAALQPTAAQREAAVNHAELTLVGWALHTSDIGALVSSVRRAGFDVEEPMPGSRRTPDGALLAWQSASIDQLGVTPFFIEWSKDTPHPSSTSPSGCTLVSMEIAHPAPERIHSLFKAVGFPATISRAERSGMKVTLECPRGRVEFRG
jgi:glyoxalase-like protein